MLPIYTRVKLLKDLPDHGVSEGAECVIVHLHQATKNKGPGYQLEVGPWDEHGAPTAIVSVSATDVTPI